MSSVLSTFGVDWRLLLVNVVNFGVLMLGLWYFLYGPLTRMLEERRQKVTQGIAAAQAAERTLSEIEDSRREILGTAGKEADAMVAEARTAAEAKGREILSRGEAAASALIKDAEAEAKELKTRALAESEREVAKLIVLGMEKVLQPVQSEKNS